MPFVDRFPLIGSGLQSAILASAMSTWKSGVEFQAGPASPSDALVTFTTGLLQTCDSKTQPGHHSEADVEQKVAELIFQPYRGYCSLQRDADALGISRQHFSSLLVRSADVFLNCSVKLLGNFFSEINTMLSSTHSGLLFVVKYRFDETPSKIAVDDLQSLCIPNPLLHQQKSTKQSKQLCKLLQTELSLSVLVKNKETKEPMLVSVSVPTPLQVLDRTTAKNIKQSLEQSLNAVPGYDAVANRCELRTFLFNADEYPANDLAEFGMQAARHDSGWVRLSTFCDVHKASTCQGRVFDLSGPTISAVINFGLSMSPAGSVGKLQAMLGDILSSRFELRVGRPPYRHESAIFQKEVLDLYFSVPDSFSLQVHSSTSTRQRLRYGQKLRQRSIIQFWCNDDWRNHDRIIHWSSPNQYQSEDEALQLFLKYMIPALIPSACPLFPRSRWFGADMSLDYVGVLASVHGLLFPLIEAWTGKKPSVENPSLFAAAIGDGDVSRENHGDDEEGWDALFGSMLNESHNQGEGQGRHLPPLLDDRDQSKAEAEAALESQVQESRGEGHHEPESQDPSAAGQGEQSTFDWNRYQEKLKTSIADWALNVPSSGPTPATMIALMRQYMGPILRLLTALMYISSNKFLKDQFKSSCQTGTRKYRMLVAFEGHDTLRLFASCIQMFKAPPVAIQELEWRQDINTLCFTMLSRLMCSVFQLLHWRRSKYPYRLLSALKGPQEAAMVFNDPVCLKDEVTQKLCQRFPSVETFSSEECHCLIETLALLAETDIAPIERQHTIARRVIYTRGNTAKAVTLKSLSADWLLRQAMQTKANLKSYMYFDSPASRAKLRKHLTKKRVKQRQVKKRRGGGGAWRAFVSCKLKGVKGNSELFKKCREEYHALSGEEKLRYQNIGWLASGSHRAGFKPFGPRTKDSSSEAQNQLMPANSDIAVAEPTIELINGLRSIKEVVRATFEQESTERDDFVSVLKSFLQGSTRLGPSLQMDDLLPAEMQAFPRMMDSIIPKPSPLLWSEWLPPADAYTQARSGPKFRVRVVFLFHVQSVFDAHHDQSRSLLIASFINH